MRIALRLISCSSCLFLKISLQDGHYNGLEGLDPTFMWSSRSRSRDMDLEYGVEAAVRPTKDVARLPQRIWGKTRTDVSGWEVTAKAEVDCQDMYSTDLEFGADNDALDASVNVVANTGHRFEVQGVEATKGMEVDGARVSVTYRYNMNDRSRDILVDYANDFSSVKVTSTGDSQWVEIKHNTGNTDVKVVASTYEQEVTVSQTIDNDNRVTPSINSKGDISVEWERRLSNDSYLTATLKPNDSLDVEWEDGDLTIDVNMPINGAEIHGATVSMKRDVFF